MNVHSDRYSAVGQEWLDKQLVELRRLAAAFPPEVWRLALSGVSLDVGSLRVRSEGARFDDERKALAQYLVLLGQLAPTLLPGVERGELSRDEWHLSDGFCGYCASDHDANEADLMNGRLVRRRLEAGHPADRPRSGAA